MKLLNKKNYLFWIDLILVIGLLGLCYLTFFQHLGEFSIRLWDEGRNAVNAIDEMLANKQWLVTYFNWQPDMWNVKPPLHIWIVALFFIFYLQRYIRTNLAYIHRPDLDRDNSCLKYGYLFRDSSIDKSGFSVVHSDNNCFSFHFYIDQNKLRRKDIGEVISGDKILSYDSAMINSLKKIHSCKDIFVSQNGCVGLGVE